MGLIRAAKDSISTLLADQWREYFYCDTLPADVLMAKGKKVLTAEEKAARKKHIKEEIQAYACMFLFIALFILMFAMFGSQSSIFGR